MTQHKYLFIDRDGTLIVEPDDKQIDSFEKFSLIPGVIVALVQLVQQGYRLVMVTNQNGLGSATFPEHTFVPPQQLLVDILKTQGIEFEDIRVCPHTEEDQCECRKPKIGLLMDYIQQQKYDRNHSYVIGDRLTDVELANNLGIEGILIGSESFPTWEAIRHHILDKPRTAQLTRKTNETDITVSIDLDKTDDIHIDTGIKFFDHMLEQLAKHGGFSATIHARGDLHIDEHHTIEDTAIVIGETLKQALGDKRGINRYGFMLPMDEATANVLLDLSGRAYCEVKANFPNTRVGQLDTEMVPHFFRSLAHGLGANLHITITGENTHHMIESSFKAVGRCLRQAITRTTNATAAGSGIYELPTTKGSL